MLIVSNLMVLSHLDVLVLVSNLWVLGVQNRKCLLFLFLSGFGATHFSVINRPGAAGAVLQIPSSVID